MARDSVSEKLAIAFGDVDGLQRRVAWKASQYLRDAAQENVVQGGRVNTGRLRDSIRAFRPVKTADGYTAGAGTDVPYAPYVEWDTRPHEIRPRRAKALRFMVGGQIIFAQKVNHPGTTGIHFMSRAAAELEAVVEDIIDHDVREWLRKAGL